MEVAFAEQLAGNTAALASAVVGCDFSRSSHVRQRRGIGTSADETDGEKNPEADKSEGHPGGTGGPPEPDHGVRDGAPGQAKDCQQRPNGATLGIVNANGAKGQAPQSVNVEHPEQPWMHPGIPFCPAMANFLKG